MPRRLIDISSPLMAGIRSDPPHMLPQIEYLDRHATAPAMAEYIAVRVDQQTYPLSYECVPSYPTGRATRKGILVKRLYVIFTMPADGIKPVMDNIWAHLAFQSELEKEGLLFAAGSNWTDDEKSWQGDGTWFVPITPRGKRNRHARSDV
jgi:hypothetical protein